jgi:integrase/recombinase XerC
LVLAAVTQLDVADYRRYLLAEGKKPAMVNSPGLYRNGPWSRRTQKFLVQGSPVKGVKGVPNEKKAPKWLARKSRAH